MQFFRRIKRLSSSIIINEKTFWKPRTLQLFGEGILTSFLHSQASKTKPRFFCKVSTLYPFGSCICTKSINFLAQMKSSCLLFHNKKKLKQLVILFSTCSKKCRIFTASCFRRIWTRTPCCFKKPKRWTSLLKKTYWTSFSLYFAPKVNRVQV